MASIALPIDDDLKAIRLRFVATIFAGSFLLFLVQPMIARMALPRLGGAPAVWNSAMLVYQGLLLAGYAYAHWLSRLQVRTQAVVHLSGFVVAALMLPIGLIAAAPPADANAFLWVPWLLLVSIGPLFLVVSAQAPLMQRWFAMSGGGDPYPLYAASNLGSFSGLIAYPLLVEPLVPVAAQSMGWSLAYGALMLLVAWCALRLPKGAASVPLAKEKVEPLGWRAIAGWIIIAAIPSGLMLSTTLHLTTDIVAMPLLWVVPLGLYLLSFSVAFSTDRRLADFFKRIAPITLLIAACGVFTETTFLPLVFAVAAIINLFAVSVFLHSVLFDRRPDPAQLTHFYLAMSVGGALGGLFCALLAPLLFDWTYEHPMLMVAAAVIVGAVSPFGPIERLWERNGFSSRAMRWGSVVVLLISLVGQGAFGLPSSKAVGGRRFVCSDWHRTSRDRQPNPVRDGGRRTDAQHGRVGQIGPIGHSGADDPQLLRGLFDQSRGRQGPGAGPWDHHSRHPEPRFARARANGDQLLCGCIRRRDCAGGGARTLRQCGTDRRRRPWGGHPRLLFPARTALDLLRDRPGDRRNCARPRPIHLPVALPAAMRRSSSATPD